MATIAELSTKIDDLSDTMNAFINSQEVCNEAQKRYNDLAEKHEADLRGNGKEGALTKLVTMDGRIVILEKSDERRKKLIDGLSGALAIMAAIEILRLVSAALP